MKKPNFPIIFFILLIFLLKGGCKKAVLQQVNEPLLINVNPFIRAENEEMAMAMKCLEFVQANNACATLNFCKTNEFKFKNYMVDLQTQVRNNDIEGCRDFFEGVLTLHIINDATHMQRIQNTVLFSNPVKFDVLLRFADYREQRGELMYGETLTLDSEKHSYSSSEKRNNFVNKILINAQRHQKALQDNNINEEK